MVPNDLQELIRRIQRLPQTDEVEFVSTLWSWWRQQPIPSDHPRIPEHELLRKFLKMRAEVLHVPAKQFHALQTATYHIFASNVVSELYPGKITIRSDLLKQIFDFFSRSDHGDSANIPLLSRLINKPEVSATILRFGIGYDLFAPRVLSTMGRSSISRENSAPLLRC